MFGFARKNSAVCIGLLLSLTAAGCSTESLPPVSQCPQPRFTGKAPDDYYERKNPLPSSEAALKAAERLYRGNSGTVACATCHGETGAGDGPLATQFDPRPRNFACAQTVNGIPDGQLFWIIRFGSPGTAMPAHSELSDEQIWQLVAYLRRLAK
jgi:cytochrome c553